MSDRSGWTQLAPGVYSDADGTCHLDAREMCEAVDPLEQILSSHLPITMEDGSVMCLCHGAHDALFRGPVYHRRHVVGFIRAHLDGEHDPFTEGPFSHIVNEEIG